MPNLETSTCQGDSKCENKEKYFEGASSKIIQESFGSNNYENEEKKGKLIQFFKFLS